MIVSMCAGWKAQKDGIADYARNLAAALQKYGVTLRPVELRSYEPRRQYYRAAAGEIAGSEVCHAQFNYPYFNGELPYKNRFIDFAGHVKMPIIMTAHEVRIGLGPLRAGFSSSMSKMAYHVLLPLMNQWSIAYHKKMYGRCARVIVHTQAHADMVRRIIRDDSKVVLLPHGIPEIKEEEKAVSISEAKKILGVAGKKVVTIVGFINRRKGYETALEMLQGLPRDRVLMIAGGCMTDSVADSTYYNELKKAISVRALDDRVVITGYLAPEKTAVVMAATDICLAPYSSTAASGALSLCIGYNKPVVASDIAVHREINARLSCLEMFKENEPIDLLHKTENLLNDPRRMAELSDKARRYSDQYSYSRIARLTIDIYDAVAGGRI